MARDSRDWQRSNTMSKKSTCLSEKDDEGVDEEVDAVVGADEGWPDDEESEDSRAKTKTSPVDVPEAK